jgi:pilus assembly protein CpaB
MELTSNRYRKDWRRVLATRRATVLVAIGCTVVAAGILIAAMSSYTSGVSAGGNPETVLVASQQIAKNTPGAAVASQGMFKATHIAAKQVTAGALADAGALQGKVAVRDIYPGEQLTAADFAAGGGLAADLAPNQRAMTVTLDAEHGMIGQLQDGDHVDVYAGVDLAQSAGGVSHPVLRLLMSNVVVLKAGTNGGGSLAAGSNANSTSPVTLNVDDSEAAAVAFAADNGKLWLALRPGNASTPAAPSLTTVQSFLSATQPISGGGAGR